MRTDRENVEMFTWTLMRGVGKEKIRINYRSLLRRELTLSFLDPSLELPTMVINFPWNFQMSTPTMSSTTTSAAKPIESPILNFFDILFLLLAGAAVRVSSCCESEVRFGAAVLNVVESGAEVGIT